MVPIHDTDVAEERWSKAEWENYELWEKIEVRLKRRKLLWIGATVFVFLLISSIPILLDRWPKWVTLSATRKLAQEINLVKREAGIEHRAIRLRVNTDLSFTIEKVSSCADILPGPAIREGTLVKASSVGQYLLLSSSMADRLGIPGLASTFCYDSLQGASALPSDTWQGFGIIPASDANNLAEPRLDRVSSLLLHGPSAELSFE